MEIRRVQLPEIAGTLFLSHLPGSRETFPEAQTAISKLGIETVVCLATEEEIRREAPAYFDAIQQESLAWSQIDFPIPIRGVPADLRSLLQTVERLVADLRRGAKVLVHCLTGVGRTGTVGMCMLIGIGLDPLEAAVRLADAEAGPESDSQESLVDRVAELRV